MKESVKSVFFPQHVDESYSLLPKVYRLLTNPKRQCTVVQNEGVYDQDS